MLYSFFLISGADVGKAASVEGLPPGFESWVVGVHGLFLPEPCTVGLRS